MESNIPPMLAAQSAFPSGPLPGFHKIFRSTNSEMIQTIQIDSDRRESSKRLTATGELSAQINQKIQ
jgi:hypothetical protein